MVKHRNLIVGAILTVITFGIYIIYWLVSTKNEMNEELGAQIPTAWLLIIPFVGIYWSYKYCEGYAKYAAKDNNTWLYFILWIFVGFVIPPIVQIKLNKIAKEGVISTPIQAQTNIPEQQINQQEVQQPIETNTQPPQQ
ncbi:MAG: DUF4234 domain-containing protein [Candidatus Woesearchaeota archaeon]|jgi:hypothetical protein|nr:DUF4234 domain-containing protein [Candidatus Woesearchaeota archaeon]